MRADRGVSGIARRKEPAGEGGSLTELEGPARAARPAAGEEEEASEAEEKVPRQLPRSEVGEKELDAGRKKRRWRSTKRKEEGRAFRPRVSTGCRTAQPRPGPLRQLQEGTVYSRSRGTRGRR